MSDQTGQITYLNRRSPEFTGAGSEAILSNSGALTFIRMICLNTWSQIHRSSTIGLLGRNSIGYAEAMEYTAGCLMSVHRGSSRAENSLDLLALQSMFLIRIVESDFDPETPSSEDMGCLSL